MKLSQFKYHYKEEQWAITPPWHRDECRLMVLHRKSQRIDLVKKEERQKGQKSKDVKTQNLRFNNILDYFNDGDAFVFNDTKVFPARLYGTKEKTDAKIEVFLLRELNEDMRLWDVLVEPARKIRIGNKLFFDETGHIVAEVIDNTTSRGRTLRFLYDGSHEDFKKELYALGETPLPRYVMRHRAVEEEDAEAFQCIYARKEGAVTAPASGLHFSRELMKRMEIKGISFAFCTLHASLACFNSIDVEDLSKHKMDSEQMLIGKEACQVVNRAKDQGKKVCIVGTTMAKATETACGADMRLKEYEGWTNKFIFPPYNFGIADAMVANFYAPESSPLMAVAAFGGYDLVMEAYKTAVKENFHFGCFGDAMLILDD